MKAKAAFYFFLYCVFNFYPWKDTSIVGKKLSKLRSIAELRAFYGSKGQRKRIAKEEDSTLGRG
jgi:hypothetical protein